MKELFDMHAVVSPSTALAPEDPRAVTLVESYRSGSALFTSPGVTLLASEIAETSRVLLGAGFAQRLSERARELFERTSAEVLMGVVPFDPGSAALLHAPRSVERAGPLERGPRRWISRFEPPLTVRSTPAPGDYERAVALALERIRGGELEKVVLGRVLELEWERALVPVRLLQTLLAARRGYGFAIDSGQDSSRTLLGVSPELLVRRSGREVSSCPLAGSIARHPDPTEDRRAAERLLASEKDRREHAFVVDSVTHALRRYCRELDAEPEPKLVQTETLWHLGTEIRGVLDDRRASSLELGLALHPTPAVCGSPTEAARRAIRELEPAPRGVFTGMVGYSDADGDGEWALVIRAGELEDRRLRLFAGAGIVRGSVPSSELRETQVKLSTLLDLLGVTLGGQGGSACH